ncbi:MAG: tyrosine-type recombinase/integrase [Dermatophilaceae bacterium]
MRDPSNTRRVLREALDRAGFYWVTSHNFRKTTATLLDDAGLSARLIADQLRHARPSMTQDVYLGRRAVDPRAAQALEDALGY